MGSKAQYFLKQALEGRNPGVMGDFDSMRFVGFCRWG
jgi:hypothetical protein